MAEEKRAAIGADRGDHAVYNRAHRLWRVQFSGDPAGRIHHIPPGESMIRPRGTAAVLVGAEENSPASGRIMVTNAVSALPRRGSVRRPLPTAGGRPSRLRSPRVHHSPQSNGYLRSFRHDSR